MTNSEKKQGSLDYSPCFGCGKPMAVTGRNVVLNGVAVGTTWACKTKWCEAYNPFAKVVP